MNPQDTTKELCFDPEGVKDNQDSILGQSCEDKLGTGGVGNNAEDKQSISLNEAGKGSSKCRQTCLPIYSALATIIIVILSYLLLMQEESDKYLTKSLKHLEHNDTALLEMSQVLISPLNQEHDPIKDDENNRNLLLPAICEGDWHLNHEVWFNHWARRRVSGTSRFRSTAESNAGLQCWETWQTCFYGPIVEASQEMEKQLANDPEHGGFWKCDTAYHIAAYSTWPNFRVGPWCDISWKWLGWEYTCYADCYADCHYVHECNRWSC